MDKANCVNSVGLVLDIAGAIVIFVFGLPEWVSRDADKQVIDAGEVGAKGAAGDPNTKWNRFGLILLILGFLLQLISNFVRG